MGCEDGVTIVGVEDKDVVAAAAEMTQRTNSLIGIALASDWSASGVDVTPPNAW
jgi:hypothetical protein